MAKERFDSQVDGQLSIEDLYAPQQKLIAVSRIFARARKEMTLAEQKCFVYALSQFRFTAQADEQPKCVYLDKKTLADVIGLKKSDPNHLRGNLRRAIGDLPRHSFIEIAQEDREVYDSGTVITRVTLLKNRVRVKFEEEYIGLFTGLSTNYITLWSSDIFGMNSKRSVQFYELLRQETDSRKETNCIGLGIKAIKEMFDIPKEGKGSYMRENGGFDRSNFEKFVIDPLCEDLLKTRMIRLIVQPDGKPYEKVKKGSRVEGYRFFWTYSSHPAVAAADEVAQLQDRVDKNPQILKVAKDLVNGSGKRSKKKSGSAVGSAGFNNFSPSGNDWDELALQVMEAQDRESEA